MNPQLEKRQIPATQRAGDAIVPHGTGTPLFVRAPSRAQCLTEAGGHMGPLLAPSHPG